MNFSYRTSSPPCVLLSTVTVFLLGATLAFAQPKALGDEGRKLVVDQNDPDCSDEEGDPYCTIQAAIDDALPGDTIEVEDGFYREDVTINVQDLTLRADDEAVIEGGLKPRDTLEVDFPTRGGPPVVQINANDVTVDGFEIRFGFIGIAGTGAAGARIEDNFIHDNLFAGIAFEGLIDSSIEDNDLEDNRDAAIVLLAATNCSLEDNAASGGRSGILTFGNDNTIEENEVTDVLFGLPALGGAPTGYGYLIVGNGNVIEDNEATNVVGEDGFRIDGDDNTIDDNLAAGNGSEDVDTKGFQLKGDRNVVVRNVAMRNTDEGFRCNRGSLDNEWRKNEAIDNEGDGFDVDGDRCTFEDNVAEDNGEDGFEIDGSENTLEDNNACENGRSGFRVFFSSDGDNVLEDNKANENSFFGFQDDTDGDGTAGTNNTYEDNECEDNLLGCSDPLGLCEGDDDGCDDDAAGIQPKVREADERPGGNGVVLLLREWSRRIP